MEINYLDIGKRIRHERDSKDITQENLAEMSGISVSHMSNIENAKTKLSLPTLINICNALECDPNIILVGNTVSNQNSAEMIITDTLSDCCSVDRAILIDTMQALKKSLREKRKEV